MFTYILVHSHIYVYIYSKRSASRSLIHVAKDGRVSLHYNKTEFLISDCREFVSPFTEVPVSA